MVKKGTKSLIGKIVCCAVTAVLIIGLCIGNAYATKYSMQITAYLAPPITDSEAVTAAQEAGQKMAARVQTEGSVLVRNENNVLPLNPNTDKKVNVFGYGSVDWVYGALSNGTSGMVRPEDGSTHELVDLLTAFRRYGISCNPALPEFYKNYLKPVFGIADANNIAKSDVPVISEPPFSRYTQSLLDEAKSYSDTAIVVISRNALEGMDMPSSQKKRGAAMNDSERNYLQISAEEEEMLAWVGKNFEKTVVIVNTGNIMEFEFLERIEGLDACLVVGLTGTRAASAIPALLYGEETPSGKLVDTAVYDFKTHPAAWGNWFGYGSYAGTKDGHGVDYVEGIYVGYKWYETADSCGVWNGADKTAVYGAGHTDYNAIVQYPFGFGLSYTTFDWKIKEITPDAGSEINEKTEINITVEVTNTGNKKGRDVVEAYVTVPYTKGGIEKSFVSLVGFAKTKVLAAGESDTVTVTIDCDDFTSYDCYDKNGNGHIGYELEQGKYYVKLMTDSHNVKKADFEGGEQGADAVAEFNVSETIKIKTDKYTGVEVTNLFTGDGALDGFSVDGMETGYNAGIPFMSRADFTEGYAVPERTAAVKNRALTEKANSALTYSAAKAEAWDNAEVDAFGETTHREKVIWGQNSGLKLAENGVVTELGLKLGADFGAEQWDAVLNQITFDEAYNLLGPAHSGNKEVNSVGKPRLYSYDSIIQIKGYNGTPRGTGNPNSVLLAQSWNKDLVYKYALAFGNEMIALNAQSVFGPGVNIHRSPFCGRNFEYMSEDTYMTSRMLCELVRGIQNKGCSVEIKHFALNEAEDYRYVHSAWLSEQALREIYLKPFQRAVQEEKASGIMTSFSGVGALWAGGSEALITGVLRKEWGFNGLVDTDWTTGSKGTPDEQLRAGGDLGMAIGLASEYNITYSESKSSNRLQYRMREAVHHILYSWLSAKYQGSQYVPEEGETTVTAFTVNSWQWWQILIVDINILVCGGCVIWILAVFWQKRKKEAAETPAQEGK